MLEGGFLFCPIRLQFAGEPDGGGGEDERAADGEADAAQHGLLYRGGGAEFFADVGRADEVGRAHRARDRVEGGDDGGAVRVERFWQGVQAVGFAGDAGDAGDGEQGESGGEGEHLGIQLQQQPQHDQQHAQQDGGGQHGVAPALAVEQAAKQRRGDDFGDASGQQDETGDGAAEQQHLLGVDGQQQFEAEEEEGDASEDDDAVAELGVAEGAQVEQWHVDAVLPPREDANQQQRAEGERGEGCRAKVGEIAARIDQPAEARDGQRRRGQVDFRTADVAQVHREVFADEQHCRQDEGHGEGEEDAPVAVVGDEAGDGWADGGGNGEHHGDDAHCGAAPLGRVDGEDAVEQQRHEAGGGDGLHQPPGDEDGEGRRAGADERAGEEGCLGDEHYFAGLYPLDEVGGDGGEGAHHQQEAGG